MKQVSILKNFRDKLKTKMNVQKVLYHIASSKHFQDLIPKIANKYLIHSNPKHLDLSEVEISDEKLLERIEALKNKFPNLSYFSLVNAMLEIFFNNFDLEYLKNIKYIPNKQPYLSIASEINKEISKIMAKNGVAYNRKKRILLIKEIIEYFFYQNEIVDKKDIATILSNINHPRPVKFTNVRIVYEKEYFKKIKAKANMYGYSLYAFVNKVLYEVLRKYKNGQVKIEYKNNRWLVYKDTPVIVRKEEEKEYIEEFLDKEWQKLIEEEIKRQPPAVELLNEQVGTIKELTLLIKEAKKLGGKLEKIRIQIENARKYFRILKVIYSSIIAVGGVALWQAGIVNTIVLIGLLLLTIFLIKIE